MHALVDAEPTTIIDVLPGTYFSSVVVSTRNVTIRGTGASPDEVVLDGANQRAVGFEVRADGVRIENLTVRRHGVAGISFEGVEGFDLERVHAHANGSYGILARSSQAGAIRDSLATGGSRAGIAVADCTPCDVTIDGVRVEGNAVGSLVSNAGSVTILRSEIRGNGTGVVLKGGTDAGGGVHVWGNTIANNDATNAPRSADALGVGVWISGGRYDVVESNLVTGHRYGIVVTGLGTPSVMDRIEGNTVDDSTLADLAWDGLGVDVCFAGNTRPDDSDPTSDPPSAQTIYSCDLPHTIGVPWPAVTAQMVAA
jgi:hypothetical protein